MWIFILGSATAPGTGSLTIGMMIAIAALLLSRVFDRAKRVWLDGDQLIYAAYGKEYSVDQAKMSAVRETAWFRPHRVEIQFTAATPHGSKIIFFPPLKWRALFGAHPQTLELKQLIAANNAQHSV